MTKLFLLGSLVGTMLTTSVQAGDEHDHDHASEKYPGARRTSSTNLIAKPATADLSKTNHLAIPPLPEGVAELKFTDFFKPIGARGLEYSDKMRALAGKRVRILGYMVRQSDPKPGLFLIAPVPLKLHEHEYGLAEDIPATMVHAFSSVDTNAVVPFTPGLLLLTGTLNIGPREEADGRISSVRLRLDPPPVTKTAKHFPPQ